MDEMGAVWMCGFAKWHELDACDDAVSVEVYLPPCPTLLRHPAAEDNVCVTAVRLRAAADVNACRSTQTITDTCSYGHHDDVPNITACALMGIDEY